MSEKKSKLDEVLGWFKDLEKPKTETAIEPVTAMVTGNDVIIEPTPAGTLHWDPVTYQYSVSDGSRSTFTIDPSTTTGDYFSTDYLTGLRGNSSIWTTTTITLNDSDFIFGNVPSSVEWEDKMPDLDKIEEMCKHYPALEKEFERFKLVYGMVKDDYDGRKERGEI